MGKVTAPLFFFSKSSPNLFNDTKTGVSDGKQNIDRKKSKRNTFDRTEASKYEWITAIFQVWRKFFETVPGEQLAWNQKR